MAQSALSNRAATTPANPPSDRRQLDRGRFRRVVTFFAGIFLNVIWWETIMRNVFGEKFVERGRSKRIRRIARRFRQLAVRMGGVMIKLGQFISTRFDVMPPEIVEELAGLQDEVPPEDLDEMMRVIEEELGQPVEDVFAEFDKTVQAAASLGQVYRAKLTNGDRVAVKVQRPGIERLVATDLEALRVVAGWAMRWSVISRRADVPALLEEFAATLWEEVNYEMEADNAERFQELFADDLRVYIPRIYREYSTLRVLTMEDVTSIKIMNLEAIDEAGVSRPVAARRLLDIYLRMVFEIGFFHADPHPGNLFIYPLPDEAIGQMYDNSPPDHNGRPFYIVFVDFGMVGHITDQVMTGLREALIAIGTRDSQRLLNAYKILGVLLPSADMERIDEMGTEVLDMMWGKSIPEVAQMSQEEMRSFASRYTDLLYEMPFQIPQDFIYLGRAVGILSGICTLLDPAFNPWEPIAKYTQKFVTREARGSALNTIAKEALSLGSTALSLPQQAQTVLNQVQRGDLSVKVTPSPEMRSEVLLLEAAVTGLTRSVITAGLLISGALLYNGGETLMGLGAFGLAAVSWITVALRRKPNR